ncbi:hypothetical protein ACPOM7_17380 [Peribacillus castrilensis]|uniref:hypothetical protein n=1 Tax=Bacillaceae TaxID=186817 RepID=UPI0006617942|nr:MULTISPECIES: hypothetical protein [Bacillaceae]MCT1390109.1 hypothetical protein [Peribacillus frigoritolerans]NCT40004.1 hypothetical protein [Peribacillus frigoritolerans]PRA73804.1 hypothetical protein CQ056_28030 [Peribacillus simplex]
MKVLKRNVVVFFVLLMGLSFIPISADAAVSKTWPVRPDSIGDWSGCTIENHQGGTISIRLFQQGIHSGQKAYTKWTLENANTGKVVRTQYVNGDFNSTLSMTSIPAGDYTLTWRSETNNDTEGWYYVVSNGGSIW